MHYHCEVYIPPKVLDGIEDQDERYNMAKAYVDDVMEPFKECDGECPPDWIQIMARIVLTVLDQGVSMIISLSWTTLHIT